MIENKGDKSSFIRAISVLVGTVVGAGIFGLPYAFVQSGFVIGLAYLLLIAALFLITKMCYAEVILRTSDDLEMAGYVERYLGKWGKTIITICLILGIFSALVAYIIGVGDFLHSLIGPLLGGNQFFWSIVFWVLTSILVLIGIGIVSRLEVLMTFGLVLVVLMVFIVCFPSINFSNLKEINLDLKNIFFPYGPVLFALGGASAVPTMRRILKDKSGKLKKAIIVGFSIPVIIYLAFCFSIIGVSGDQTSEIAIIGLSKIVDGRALIIGSIFGILAMSTSFLALSYFLRELFRRDYHLPLIPAWLIVIAVPAVLFALGMRSFITVISFAGGVLSGLQSIILILTYYQAKKKGDRQPEFQVKLSKPLAYFIYLIFIFGILYQFLYI